MRVIELLVRIQRFLVLWYVHMVSGIVWGC